MRCLTLLPVLLLLSCDSPPAQTNTWHVDPGDNAFVILEFRVDETLEWTSICVFGSGEVGVSLSRERDTVEIWGPQWGQEMACLEPDDGVFEDIVIDAGTWEITALGAGVETVAIDGDPVELVE